MADEPFRLLNLPPELRLLTYERIAITTCHREIKRLDCADEQLSAVEDFERTITMALRCVESSILSTCTFVRQEATPVFARKFRQINAQPIRYRTDWYGAMVLVHPGAALRSCFDRNLVIDDYKSQDELEAFINTSCSRLKRATVDGNNNFELTILNNDKVPILDKLIALLYALSCSPRWDVSITILCNKIAPSVLGPSITGEAVVRHFHRILQERIVKEKKKPRAEQRRIRVELQVLSDEAWAKHNETW
ncbi:hypothetical protein FB567DRAFT_621112 [Paraphoma chrysanthemicola]|uniref:Uncharacterized protein n=1 Tax=Paraphoma chrysanthemicola TaxID=798071 RepID=A0A8K0VYA9_9PLEO|nr:hypothetical protein FB567DRAFT_621112 [Paraphoma chrysanthemicola]